MIRQASICVVLAVGLAGCDTTNRAPGNDREAAGAAPEPPAAVVAAAEVLAAGAANNVQPEAMSPVDIASLSIERRCEFRLTRNDFPSVVFGPKAAALRTNGKLVVLPMTGDGRYGGEGIDVQVNPARSEPGGLARADLVVHAQGASAEHAYLGWVRCSS